MVTDAYLCHIKTILINFLDKFCDNDLCHELSFEKSEYARKSEVIISQLGKNKVY